MDKGSWIDWGFTKETEEKKKSDDSRYEEFTKEAANDPKLKLLTSSELHKKFKVITAEKDQKAHDEELWRPHGSGIQTGVYELIGVIVHKGRQADSGHYVGLTVHKGGNSQLTCLTLNFAR